MFENKKILDDEIKTNFYYDNSPLYSTNISEK